LQVTLLRNKIEIGVTTSYLIVQKGMESGFTLTLH
jgi:hypothetical protein